MCDHGLALRRRFVAFFQFGHVALEVAFHDDEIGSVFDLGILDFDILRRVLILSDDGSTLARSARFALLFQVFFRVFASDLFLAVAIGSGRLDLLPLEALYFFFLLQVVVELLNFGLLQLRELVLVDELRAVGQPRVEEEVVLVIMPLREVVYLAVDELGRFNAHQTESLRLYNWRAIFANGDLVFGRSLLIVVHHSAGRCRCAKRNEDIFG